ncbi:MAG: hypothetical protein OSJ72_17060 [Lachnospiraceae bacterium]|nr:hypothetical protein [Lachnospiraceae bacterium]
MYGILASAQTLPTSWIDTAAEKGIVAILLIIFVWFFLKRSRNDDERVKQAYETYNDRVREAYETSQKNMEEQNRVVREREDYLLAESAKREEIIRTEAERREKLIRTEAEKRESILMASQDRMLETLDNIATSLNKMERSMAGLDQRLDAMERKIGNGSAKGDGS